MGNDPSRPLIEVIGDYDPARFSDGNPWQQMHIAEPGAVEKLLANQRASLAAMLNGTATADSMSDSPAAAAAASSQQQQHHQRVDALDPTARSATVRLVTLWRLNKDHPSINGDRNLANVATWLATACSRERSKWMVPTGYLPREQDLLSLPGRNCHIIRFHRGEPFDAMQKCTIEDRSINCGGIDIYLTSAGLYAPLLIYDSRACERARFTRSAIVPPAPPALSSMCVSELMLGLVDVCFGLCFLHQEHPLSSASVCTHNNLSWAALYVRTDAVGSRLPWVIGDPRFSRVAAHGSAVNVTGAFNRNAKERDFCAPEVARGDFNEENNSNSKKQHRQQQASTASSGATAAPGSGDMYSFGRLIESILPPPTTRDNDPVTSAARKELERFASLAQQSDPASRPVAADFLKLACVRQCAFARMMRLLDYFFPWCPVLASTAAATAAAASAEQQQQPQSGENYNDNDGVGNTNEDADDEDDIVGFALDVAFGVSPRQLPSSVLNRVKALFFATLHLESLKIPSELFMRRVVPRVLDHQVFCAAAASPFLWQLITPMRGADAVEKLMMVVNTATANSNGNSVEQQDQGEQQQAVSQLPVCGLLQQNDLRHALIAFLDSGAALPTFTLERPHASSANVMFANRENARVAAEIAQSRHRHKTLFFLRAIDLLLAQATPDHLAKMFVPFVAACLASPTEFIVRTALSALRSIMQIVAGQKLDMQEIQPDLFAGGKSKKQHHRGGNTKNNSDQDRSDDDDDDSSNNDSSDGSDDDGSDDGGDENKSSDADSLNGGGDDKMSSSDGTSPSPIDSAAAIGGDITLDTSDAGSASSASARRRARKRRELMKLQQQQGNNNGSKGNSNNKRSGKIDQRWYFAVLITLRALIKASQITLNETAQHETQVACFSLCCAALDLGFTELRGKLVSVAQRVAASPSATAFPHNLKIAAIEFLYAPVQDLNRRLLAQMKSSSSSSGNKSESLACVTEVLPFCLAAAQNPGNPGTVRSLATKIVCIILNICESPGNSSSNRNNNNMITAPASLNLVADRWDAASSASSPSSLLGVEVKALGANFAPDAKKQQQVVVLDVFSVRSVRNGAQIKIFSRREPRGYPLRRVAVMLPADFAASTLQKSLSAAATTKKKQQVASAISWLSHDADHRLNTAQLLNAAAVFRFFSEREPLDPTPIRPHALAAKLPTRCVSAATGGATATTSAAGGALDSQALLLSSSSASSTSTSAASPLAGLLGGTTAGKRGKKGTAAVAAAAAVPSATRATASNEKAAQQPQINEADEPTTTATTVASETKPATASATGKAGLRKRRAAAVAAEAIAELGEEQTTMQHQPEPPKVRQAQQQQPVVTTAATATVSPAKPPTRVVDEAPVVAAPSASQPVPVQQQQQQVQQLQSEVAPVMAEDVPVETKKQQPNAKPSAASNASAVPRRRRAGTATGAGSGGESAPAAVPAVMLEAVMDDL